MKRKTAIIRREALLRAVRMRPGYFGDKDWPIGK
jgi:hypothetical protein